MIFCLNQDIQEKRIYRILGESTIDFEMALRKSMGKTTLTILWDIG